MNPPEPSTAERSAPRRARLSDYLSLARPSHWVKQILIVPGVILAMLLYGRPLVDVWLPIVAGFLSASLLASANYVLNEWLDQRSDRHHPEKRHRAAASNRVSRNIVFLEYVILVLVGGILALQVSPLFAWTSVLFLIAGLVYNVQPVRTKDQPYLDVVSESFNNPIRLTMGWAMVETIALPPASLLLGYWLAGAFLMTVKRLAEYRMLAALTRPAELHLYRRSFRGYSEISLLVAALLYSLLSAFFIAVFVVKYRIEYVVALPVLAFLFGLYLIIGLEERSAAQAPERLFRERRLLVTVGILFVLLAVLTWVDIPSLHQLADPHFIELDFRRGG